MAEVGHVIDGPVEVEGTGWGSVCSCSLVIGPWPTEADARKVGDDHVYWRTLYPVPPTPPAG